MSDYQLAIEIIKRSVNPTWELAKREWKLVEIEEAEDYETCLCGHYPIRELCILKKKDTAKSLNAETIQLAFNLGWINKWENDFYLDIMRKRVLTERQRAKKLQVNEKVLRRVRRTKRAHG